MPVTYSARCLPDFPLTKSTCGVVMRIKYGDIVDSNGQPLFPPIKKRLISVHYQRTEQERDFLSELQDFAKSMSNMQSFGKLQEAIVIRNAASSVYAIQGMLRRLRDAWSPLRNRMAHGIVFAGEDVLRGVQQQLSKVTDILGDTDDVLADIDQSPVDMTMQLDQFLNLFNKLESLLDRIEDIRIDSKLNALTSYVQEFRRTTDKPYLCIWSSFISTVQYLSTSLQDIGMSIYVITGALEPARRQYVVNAFQENGGILITTDAASTEVALQFVDKA
jgi:hypothetical protein